METELERVYTWVMDCFPENDQEMLSDPFSCGGTEWMICAFNSGGSNMTLSLAVYENDTWRDGWKIKAKYYLVVFDKAYKELCRSPETTCFNFCKELYYHSTVHDMLSLNVIQQQGKRVMDNKLIIKVYMNVFEVHQGKSSEDNMVDCSGFNVLPSQVNAVFQIFLEHPDSINVEDFRPKNGVEKTAYMYVLLDLIETLKEPPESLSDTDLCNAHRKLGELTKAGFKLDWLVTKLEDAKNTKSQAHNVLAIRIKDLELTLSHLKDEMEKMKSAADKKV